MWRVMVQYNEDTAQFPSDLRETTFMYQNINRKHTVYPTGLYPHTLIQVLPPEKEFIWRKYLNEYAFLVFKIVILSKGFLNHVSKI